MFEDLKRMYKLKQFINKLTKIDYIFVVVLLLAASWYLSNLNGSLEHDEVRYATTGYTILTTGKLIDLGVTNNPPLLKYIIGLSQVIFGISSFSIRLPSVLFGLGTLFLVYIIGRKWSSYVGISSVLLLIFTYGFSRNVTLGFLDIGLTFLILLSLFIFIMLKDKEYFPIIFGISTGLIIVSKLTGLYIVSLLIFYMFYLSYQKKEI